MKFLFAMLLFIAAPAWATDYYACDCSTGSYPSVCVAGTSGQNGTSAATPKQTYAQIVSSYTVTAGDSILFGRGCTWTGASDLAIASLSATEANPITLDQYTPSWCTGDCASLSTWKPKITYSSISRGGIDLSNYAGSGNGYNIKNLQLVGTGYSSGNAIGLNMYGGHSGVIVDGVDFSSWGTGANCSSFNGLSHRIAIRNSSFNDIGNIGIVIGCDSFLVENNTFYNNGACAPGGCGGAPANQRHSIYFGGDSSNSIVRGNSMTHTSYYAGQCDGPPIVGHGTNNGWIIENNYIYETSAGGGCYGINISEGYSPDIEVMNNVIIRGNVIENVGSIGINIQNAQKAILENNVIANTLGNSHQGIRVTIKSSSDGDPEATGTKVRNNSIYMNNTASGNIGINVSIGSNNEVANNLIYYDSGATATRYCFEKGSLVIGNFTYWDRNLCYFASGTGTHQWSSASASAPSGFDTNGLTSDPQLAATPTAPTWSMKVQAGSPAINAGSDTYGSRLSIKGYPKVSTRDIGAYEFGSNP